MSQVYFISFPLASSPQYLFDICLLQYVQTVFNSWWWTERKSETCRALLQ